MDPKELCELIRKEFAGATIEHILANFIPEWYEMLQAMAADDELSGEVSADMGGNLQVSVFRMVCGVKRACGGNRPQEVFFKRVPRAEQNMVPFEKGFTYGIYARDEYAVCGIGFHRYPETKSVHSKEIQTLDKWLVSARRCRLN